MFGSDDFLPGNYGAEPMRPITEAPRPQTLADFAALSNSALVPASAPAHNPAPQILGNVGVATVINPHLPPAPPRSAPPPMFHAPPVVRMNGRLRATNDEVPAGSPFGLPYGAEEPTKVVSYFNTSGVYSHSTQEMGKTSVAASEVDLLAGVPDDAQVIDWGDDDFTFQCAMGLIEGPYDEIDGDTHLGDATDEEVREGPLKKLKARRASKKVEQKTIETQLKLLDLGWRFDENRRQWYIDVSRPGYLYRVYQDEAVAILEGKLPKAVKAHGQIIAPEASQAVAIRQDVADNIMPGFTTMFTAGEKPLTFPPPTAKAVMKKIAKIDEAEEEKVEAEEVPEKKERRKRRLRPKRKRGGKKKSKKAKASKKAPSGKEERREKLTDAALQVARRFTPSGSSAPPSDDLPPPSDDDADGGSGGGGGEESSEGLPKWAWALIALGGAAVVGGTAYVVLKKRKERTAGASALADTASQG